MPLPSPVAPSQRSALGVGGSPCTWGSGPRWLALAPLQPALPLPAQGPKVKVEPELQAACRVLGRAGAGAGEPLAEVGAGEGKTRLWG